MRGTANVPGKKPTLSGLNAQEKLAGTESQYVGFNKNGEATARNLSEINKEIGAQPKLVGTAGQFVGFNDNGEAVARPLSEIGCGTGGNTGVSHAVFFGVIGTNWTEDAATGVKYQLVEIDGVLASHEGAVLDVVMAHERTSDGYAAYVEENNQFLDYITNGDAETVDGGVMFYIYGEPNTVEINFGLEVG